MPELEGLIAGSHRDRVGEYLSELELSGLVARDHAWNLQTGRSATMSRFRLKDNYLRFYLKYIGKNLDDVNAGRFILKSLTSLPEWLIMMGLQFENLLLDSRHRVHGLLGLTPDEIVNDNPFFQHKTARQPGCQIDYLIHAKFDCLYICEVKFSRNQIGSDIIPEVQGKIASLSRPKGLSCRPVLIHVNGVTEDLVDSSYFSHIIDASRLLEVS
jgi:uncharacterized protein